MLSENDLRLAVIARGVLKSGIARTRREEANVSLREMATLIGVAPISLSRWERGLAQPRVDDALAFWQVMETVLEAVDDQTDITSTDLEQREHMNESEQQNALRQDALENL